MKFFISVFALFISYNTFSQRNGYKEFIVGKKLSDQLYQKYAFVAGNTKENIYVALPHERMEFCDLQIDSLIVYTDKSRTIKAVVLQTKYISYPDFRALNFEWFTVRRCVRNDYSSGVHGQIRFQPILISVWGTYEHVQLSISVPKIDPQQKNVSRRFSIKWEQYPHT